MNTVLESRTRAVVIGPDQPVAVIGERINPTGRNALAEDMKAGTMDLVRQDALAQVEAGAHMLDVNAGIPGVDEAAVLVAAARAVQAVTDVPLCIDSSVVEALEAALAACDGKALVNSVTGEDERLECILPIAKKHGAAVIGLAHDETGISMEPAKRLAAARRIVERASDHGIPPEDVVIDPIVTTVATDSRSAAVTLETIRLVREKIGSNTVCGASNVSFGLPDRKHINVAFLTMAIHAGLGVVITNPLVPEIRKAVHASDLLLGRDEYAAAWIAAHRAEQAAAG